MVLETELVNVKAPFDGRCAVLVVEAPTARFKIEQIGRVRDLLIRIWYRPFERADDFHHCKLLKSAAAPLPLERGEAPRGVT
jgi:hypothetical protein